MQHGKVTLQRWNPPGVDFTSPGRECSPVSQWFFLLQDHSGVQLLLSGWDWYVTPSAAEAHFLPPFLPHRHLKRIKLEPP